MGLQIAPKSIQKSIKNHLMPTCPQETTPRGPKTAPRGPQTLPRGSKIAPRGSQDPPKRPSERPRASKDPPKRPQEYTQRPYEVASLLPVLCCSSRLNHIQFIIQLCIGSSQESIKNIQELSKTNILEPPSFQASLPLSLQVPAAKRLGGIREAQTIWILHFTLNILPAAKGHRINQ